MEAYKEAKRVILRRTAIWALLIAFILCMLASVGLIVMAFLVTAGSAAWTMECYSARPMTMPSTLDSFLGEAGSLQR
jgi:hypothetical protein